MAETEVIVGRSPGQIAWRRFRKNKVGVVSAALSVIFVAASIFAPLISKIFGVDPNTMHLDILDTTGVPKLPHYGMGLSHPLGLIPGTGRDLFAQLLYGSRISFFVTFVATFFSLLIGLAIGVTSGYFRGRVDNSLGRITDFMLSFPSFFMIVALTAPVVDRIERSGIAHGNNARILFLIIFLSIFGWPYFSRLIRAQTLSLRERDFISAAIAQGASHRRVIFKELAPNLWAPLIVFITLSLPAYLTSESVYSFLGIGVQPPASTWGVLLSNSTRFVTTMPQFFVITAGTLVLVVLAFNLAGDAVRDALDPKFER